MTREPPQRRKIKPAWVIGLLCVVFLALFFYQLFGPNPAIVVSKETTFITAPLGKDGLPDYEAYLIERGSQGVTPENNAAVLIWQALWPGDLNPEHWLPLCEALGMEGIPSKDESLVPVYDESVRERLAVWLNALKCCCKRTLLARRWLEKFCRISRPWNRLRPLPVPWIKVSDFFFSTR